MPQFSTIAANSVESAEFGARGSVVFCPSLPSPLPFFLLPFFFPFFLSPFCCVFPHYSPLPLFAVFGLSRLGVPTVFTGGTPGRCCKYLSFFVVCTVLALSQENSCSWTVLGHVCRRPKPRQLTRPKEKTKLPKRHNKTDRAMRTSHQL